VSATFKALWQSISRKPASFQYNEEEFRQAFTHNLETCAWEPHPLYSVFTQYDQEYYLAQRDAFLHKYKCFYAVSKTIGPRKIIELGTCAGSSADAYLGGSPKAKYVGLDVYGENVRHDDGTPWKPYEIAGQLFKARGYKKWRLVRADLRTLTRLPSKADMVVVDAAHDFENEYADLRLALTADPDFIFVDDAADELQAKPAIEKFLAEDLRERVDYTLDIDYLGGGVVIRLKR
jgi:predicted O-methyltransferase YrrM